MSLDTTWSFILFYLRLIKHLSTHELLNHRLFLGKGFVREGCRPNLLYNSKGKKYKLKQKNNEKVLLFDNTGSVSNDDFMQ